MPGHDEYWHPSLPLVTRKACGYLEMEIVSSVNTLGTPEPALKSQDGELVTWASQDSVYHISRIRSDLSSLS